MLYLHVATLVFNFSFFVVLFSLSAASIPDVMFASYSLGGMVLLHFLPFQEL